VCRQGQRRNGHDESLLERLPYGYRLELERRHADARAASLLAIEVLAAGYARMRGEELEPSRLRFPQGGKPQLDDGPWFSVSHSGTRVAVALCERCEIGFDLEDHAGFRGGAGEVLRWTAIESVLKAAGAGLRRAADVRLADDCAMAWIDDLQWYLQPVVLGPGCTAHIATSERLAAVQVEAWRRP
jgi:hypothetical protein